MDALAEKIGALRLRRASWQRLDLRPGGVLPFAARRDGPRLVVCHQVLSGTCHLEAAGRGEGLAPDRLVLLAREEAHVLQAGAASGAQVLWGRWELDDASAARWFPCLPPLMAVTLNDRMGALRAATVASLPGASALPACQDAVLQRLAEAMLLQALSAYADQAPEPERHLLLGTDLIVSRCLALMHRDPARAWTLPRLANEVNTSRSVLSARFHEVVGEPPMSHLTRLRLAAAARLLLQTPWQLGRIAEAAGYQSEPSFNRAFRRQFGAPPAAWRRRMQDAALGQRDAYAS